jgi:hypothetical protein
MLEHLAKPQGGRKLPVDDRFPQLVIIDTQLFRDHQVYILNAPPLQARGASLYQFYPLAEFGIGKPRRVAIIDLPGRLEPPVRKSQPSQPS